MLDFVFSKGGYDCGFDPDRGLLKFSFDVSELSPLQ